MTGRHTFWQLLRFELFAQSGLQLTALAWWAPLLRMLMAPSDLHFSAIDFAVVAFGPMVVAWSVWVAYAPQALAGSRGLDPREFLLSRPVSRRQHYWVKTTILCLLVAIPVLVFLGMVAVHPHMTIDCTRSEQGRYLTGLPGSQVRLDERLAGDEQVWVPDGALRVAAFEIWLLLALTLLAQTAVVRVKRRGAMMLFLLLAFMLVMGDAALSLLGGDLLDAVTRLVEDGLFLFDGHPLTFWLIALVLAAVVQRSNARRFAQMEMV
jgi:ABC-type Na+ efflux pump permease subunit